MMEVRKIQGYRQFEGEEGRWIILCREQTNLQAEIMEDVLILRDPSLKLKTVADNAILLNRFTSSENISIFIKIKTETLFNLKVNV